MAYEHGAAAILHNILDRNERALTAARVSAVGMVGTSVSRHRITQSSK